jgi:hypothetical protein
MDGWKSLNLLGTNLLRIRYKKSQPAGYLYQGDPSNDSSSQARTASEGSEREVWEWWMGTAGVGMVGRSGGWGLRVTCCEYEYNCFDPLALRCR